MTLEAITSDGLAATKHGFFTRLGGASSGIFKGLNCGIGSSDQSEAVNLNRTRVAHFMNVHMNDLVTVHQCHSSDVVTVSKRLDIAVKADALVTSAPGVAIAVLTADCQPVLFSDKRAGVIGAAHAGWKGAMAGILENTLDAMEALGAKRQNIAAVIGPTISQAAYEVGAEFMDIFLTDNPDNGRFFAQGEADKYQFDLPAYGLHRLRSAGVGQAEWTRDCTYGDPKRFYSYRRSVHQDEADYGRLISAIRI